MSPSSGTSIYAEQLVACGHGVPLWRPEPNSFGEVHIGDVGFRHDGSFVRLFNVMRSRDDPANSHGLPDNFSQLHLPINSSNLPRQAFGGVSTQVHENVAEKSASGFGQTGGITSYTFNCLEDRGAVAVAGNCTTQRVAPSSAAALREYVSKSHSSWFNFARSKGYDVRPEEIVLVSGFTKTSEWAIAAYKKTASRTAQEFSFDSRTKRFTLTGSPNVNLWMEQRSGPSRSRPLSTHSSKRASMTEPPKDQCLFIWYHKVRHQKGSMDIPAEKESGQHRGRCLPVSKVFKRPVALLRRVFRRRPVEIEEGPDINDNELEPIDHILTYILKNSSAQVAISSYEDLYAISPPSERQFDISKYLRRDRPQITVDNNTGYLAHPIEIKVQKPGFLSKLTSATNSEYAPGRFKRRLPKPAKDTPPEEKRRDPSHPSRPTKSTISAPSRSSTHTLVESTTSKALKGPESSSRKPSARKDTQLSNSSTIIPTPTLAILPESPMCDEPVASAPDHGAGGIQGSISETPRTSQRFSGIETRGDQRVLASYEVDGPEATASGLSDNTRPSQRVISVSTTKNDRRDHSHDGDKVQVKQPACVVM